MSIAVKSITKSYGSQLAVNDISFTVSTGEIVGFIGPNGAGKSTTMKIITGTLPPDKGEVLIGDMSVGENLKSIRKIIGYLPENNPLYPEMYIREYLEYVAGLIPDQRENRGEIQIDRVIEMTGLTPEVHKKIGSLSKGFRQRVGLSQALIHDPEILILDEPTTGLDPNQLTEIRSLISNIGNQKDRAALHAYSAGGGGHLRPGNHHQPGDPSWPMTVQQSLKERGTGTIQYHSRGA